MLMRYGQRLQSVVPYEKLQDYQDWAKREGYPGGYLEAQGSLFVLSCTQK